MREYMRNTDRAMSNLEALPGGFNALRQLYENVQEPLLNATQGGGGDGAANPLASMLAAAGLGSGAAAAGTGSGAGAAAGARPGETAPLPNPWAAGSGAGSGGTVGGGSAAAGGGAAGDLGALAGLGGIGGLPAMDSGAQAAMMQQVQGRRCRCYFLANKPLFANQQCLWVHRADLWNALRTLHPS
jgi:ubiquilin